MVRTWERHNDHSEERGGEQIQSKKSRNLVRMWITKTWGIIHVDTIVESLFGERRFWLENERDFFVYLTYIRRTEGDLTLKNNNVIDLLAVEKEER